jgi:hypothetical protein
MDGGRLLDRRHRQSQIPKAIVKLLLASAITASPTLTPGVTAS